MGNLSRFEKQRSVSAREKMSEGFNGKQERILVLETVSRETAQKPIASQPGLQTKGHSPIVSGPSHYGRQAYGNDSGFVPAGDVLLHGRFGQVGIVPARGLIPATGIF